MYTYIIGIYPFEVSFVQYARSLPIVNLVQKWGPCS